MGVVRDPVDEWLNMSVKEFYNHAWISPVCVALEGLSANTGSCYLDVFLACCTGCAVEYTCTIW